MKILVINGPNLNMLGIREPDLYGTGTYDALCEKIEVYCATKGVAVSFYQSNHEGALVDRIQEAYYEGVDGIVINPGAYTHTSIAILDAVKAVGIPTVEVHISKVEEREAFRQISYIRAACIATITGKGFDGYVEAIDVLMKRTV
jgi:3-dehydroquinate dehydratase-2